MLTAERRLRYYFHGVAGAPETAVGAETQGVLVPHDCDMDGFRQAMARWDLGRGHLAGPEARVQWLFDAYVRPVVDTCQRTGLEGLFLIRPGDTRDAFALPTIAKSRRISDLTNCVLFPLNPARHLRPMREVAAADRPFRQKEAKVVWRGATTGRFSPRDPGSRYHVADWAGRNPRIDVGYSEIVQLSPSAAAGRIAEAVRPKLSRGKQMTARYFLSLEGNDVASGLKWMLLSNSVVMMPPPTVESWACEALLVPWVHYVPIRPDLTDVEEKLEMCEADLAMSEEIAKNSTHFMHPFTDTEAEGKIRFEVLRKYLSNFEVLDTLQ